MDKLIDLKNGSGGVILEQSTDVILVKVLVILTKFTTSADSVTSGASSCQMIRMEG